MLKRILIQSQPEPSRAFTEAEILKAYTTATGRIVTGDERAHIVIIFKLAEKLHGIS